MTWGKRGLLCNHEDLSSNPLHPPKESGIVVPVCIPSAGEMGKTKVLLRFAGLVPESERLNVFKKIRNKMESHRAGPLTASSGLWMHRPAHMHITYMYHYTHKISAYK